jgi:hypothetical protein
MTKRLSSLILGLLLGQILLGLPAYAQEERPQTAPPQSPGYEENLRRWKNMPESEREALRQKVRSMSPEEKTLLRDNSEKFSRLPSEEKRRLQNNFREFKKMPDQARTVLREKSDRFQKLAPEKRESLRREAARKNDRRSSPKKNPSAERERPADKPSSHGHRARNDGMGPAPKAGTNDHPRIGNKKESRAPGGTPKDKKTGKGGRKNR